MRKIISVLLTITMLLSITASIPLNTSAIDSISYTNDYSFLSYSLINNGTGYRITGYSYDKIDFFTNGLQLEIPESINNIPVVEIGERAFSEFEYLTYIIIPDTVTTIGDFAFEDCGNLKNVFFSDTLTSIGEDILAGCYNLMDIFYTGDEDLWNCISIGESNYDLRDTVTHFNSNIKVDEQGIWIYELSDFDDGYKITDFEDDYEFSDITIPSTINNIPIVEIGDYAFLCCYNISSVTIPDGVTVIGEYAFEACASMVNIKIPDSVHTFGEYVFSYCTNLTSIKLPDSITTISESMFECCNNLTNITIPDSVTTIDSNAFIACYNLTDVYYQGSESEWNRINILPINDDLLNATIHYNYVAPLAGDISGDGEIAVDDVIYVLKYIIEDIELSEYQLNNADVNNDGMFTVLDAILIQKMILETA